MNGIESLTMHFVGFYNLLFDFLFIARSTSRE